MSPKASHLLQNVRWRPFDPTSLAPEDIPARLVHIVTTGRTDYYISGDSERSLYRFTRYRQGKRVNEWHIGDIG